MNEDKKDILARKAEEPNLSYTETRELQYLIKSNYENADKQKYFGLICLYRNGSNVYLKIYLRNLLEKLRKES